MIKIVEKYKNLPYTVKASFWFLVATFFQRGISVLTTPIFTRLMNTAEYGQYNVFASWLDIFTVFVSLKLYAGVFSAGYVKFDEDKEKFSASLQGLCVTLVAIWMAIYFVFHNQINAITTLSTIQTLAMFSIIWTTSVFTFWSVEQRTENKYVQIVVITISISIIKPVVSILAVINSDDKATARIVSIAIVELVIYIWLFIKDICRGKSFIDKRYWMYALSFNIPLIPHYLSTSILNSSDRIMIQKLVNKDAAGIYGLAYSISMIMTLFNTALIQTLEPWIFKKIKENKTDEIGKVVYISLLLIGGVNLFLISFAPEAVRFFAPKEYYEAIWVIPPVAMSVVFMYSYSIFATFEFYYEKKKYISISTTAGALLNVILNYFCIRKWGYFAAGYTTLICYMLYAFLHYLVMRSVCKNELKTRVFDEVFLIKFFVIFILASFGLLLTYNFSFARYIVIGMSILLIGIKRKSLLSKFKLILEIRK